jgi:DNA-binding transcriptional regulator YdaS (Cro superfamily)
METQALGQKVLAQAVMKVGGPAALARYLGVSVATLDRWLLGHELPPAETVHRAVDLVRERR